MMVAIEEAQAKLSELLKQLAPGEELLIVEDGQALAKIKKVDSFPFPSKAGCYQKAEFWMAPDFDAPLDDFKNY